MKPTDSPYLAASGRLGDVIAAIQAMGTYKFYKLDFSAWADRISGDTSQGNHWREIFEQHPEFFRLDSQRKRASLVWRRQHQKLFDVDKEAKISREEYRELTPDKQARLSRMPLASSELATLINAAIELHSRALARKQDTRWWISGVMSLVGVVVGIVLKAALDYLTAHA
jgi:hypothetical protein